MFGITGYLAETKEQYASAILTALRSRPELDSRAQSSRARAAAFSDEVFEDAFWKCVQPIISIHCT